MVLEKLIFWRKKPKFDFDEKPMFGEEPHIPELGARDDLGLPKMPGEEPLFGETGKEGGADIFKKAPTTEEMAEAIQPPPVMEHGQMRPVQQVSSSELAISNEMLSKDLALISSKLDTIRAQMDTMNHRIANIEKVAYEEEKEAKRW